MDLDKLDLDMDMPDMGDMEMPNMDFNPDEDAALKVGPEKSQDEEKAVGPSEGFGFETNTRQILDIVARSLYHDKEVFIRELISNASDAIEKIRYMKLISDRELEEPTEPRISMFSDPEKNTFTIQDSGVGMTKEELVNNLGTIASSGSKQLMEQLKSMQADAGDQIIGQFGVGFYSAFIVAKSVKVYTKSCLKGSTGYLWESDGHGQYSITEAEGVAPGTKIVVELKEDERDFSDDKTLQKIIQKYSNFIGSPIVLNGKRINTVEALWRKNPKDVTDEQYEAFYKFVSSGFDKPTYRLHYRVDAPVDVKSILFVPGTNMEQPGRNRLTPSVNLYCKKVLIKAKCPDLLPDWMRFVNGVVDSEDLPLNVSREGTMDSRAFKKLAKLVTNRVLKWLGDEADKDREKYVKFFKDFGFFLKEGVCMDKANQPTIAKLLRFESSKLEEGQVTSFDEYIERFVEGQDKIYFLHSPSRSTAFASPYYEQLKRKGVEVLFMYGSLDEYVMANVTEYKGHKFTSIENAELGLENVKDQEDAPPLEEEDGPMLSPKQCRRFSKFLAVALDDRCAEAKPSSRLTDSPAIVPMGFEQATMFRHLKQMATLQGKRGYEGPMGMQTLEYNPRHPIIKRLYWLSRNSSPEAQARAERMAEQIFDNALIASGLLEDPRMMLGRLNSLMRDALSDIVVEADDDEVGEPDDEPAAGAGTAGVTPAAGPMDQAFEKEMEEKYGEEVAGMVEETMRRNTTPIDPEVDLDVQDAEFTVETPKAPEAGGAAP